MVGGGFLKSQAMGLWFRDIDLMVLAAGADSAGSQTARLRLFCDVYWGAVRFSVAEETRYIVESSGMDNLGSIPGFGTTTGARPRLFEIPGVSDTGLLVENDLDRLFVKAALGPVDVTVGRQAISWESAWFWKPTDRFGPFSPMDIDPEVKRGVDAARAEVYFGPTTSLDLLSIFERHDGDAQAGDRTLWVSGGARFRSSLGRHDLALSLARFQYAEQGNWMLGLEMSSSVGPLGVRGEASVNVLENTRDWDLEGVLGADYRFPFGLQLSSEFFYNGYGVSEAEDYAELLADPEKGERIARGETFSVGRTYLGLMADQAVHPLVHLTLSALCNLGDPSLLVIGGMRWWVVQDARVTAGAMIPVGEKPDGTVLRSEFGSVPLAGYLVLKVAF